MDLTRRIAQESHCERKKVGALAVRNGNVLAFGWNGTPAGQDNCCEEIRNNPETGETEVVSKREVLHAETQLVTKIARSHESLDGSTVFVTLSPCVECAKLLYQSGVVKVYYEEKYRDTSGIELLEALGVEVEQLQ